ncbi:hypothetical protein [Pseudoduganella albidiflava]|uniref:DUF7847 domain-containing protein n=1 Tax=Pseudoduganella albidiflava TaxID=321983 RepID=A0A411WW97_9BURK|nr:hypothetical protein [Pseudoduganella albidiflava]QBI00919.1 hypothetical protein EYF70_08710 [Pseudoduganella albidiflava]GGY60656.1 hypothetical protein GCM10007387_49060 [Pseudoduganella albidiflava]
MFTISSTPLGWIDVGRATQRLFFKSFLRVLPYALAPVALLLGLLGLGVWVAGEHGDREWILYLCALLLLLCPALMSPLLHQVHACAHARPATARESLARGLRCLLPCLAASALFMLAVGSGAVLLLLPGLYLFVALSFWWPALVIDGVRPVEALKASRRLVRGHWWRVAIGYCLVLGVAVLVDRFDISTVSLPDNLAGAIVALLLSAAVTALVPMFVSANMVVLYNDLVLRDLVLRDLALSRSQAPSDRLPA